jgi:SAM-dependent methyltransferase
MPSLCTLLTAAACGGVAYLIGSSPATVAPPQILDGSPLQLQAPPPWPIFRAVTAVRRGAQWVADSLAPPGLRVLELSTQYRGSLILYTFADTKLADPIAAKGGTASCLEVAKELELDEDFTCRMLRAAAKEGLVVGDGAGAVQDYTLTPIGEMLVSDHPSRASSMVRMLNDETLSMWQALPEALLTGRSPSQILYGQDSWEYYTDRPDKFKRFEEAMDFFSTAIVPSLLSGYSFPSSGVICDIGGGSGQLIEHLVAHYPDASFLLMDLSAVAEIGRERFRESKNVQVFGGSFFDPLPSEFATCDLIIMKFIIHDWDDDSSVKILKNIATVLKDGAKLALLEFCVDGSFMADAIGMDINMMAANLKGARERTEAEWRTLLEAGGLRFSRNIELRSPMQVIESRKAQ